mmetsp:Transcript_29704/g.64717  ORF Transcript_29704/g.64717 Transcript_29704/m.64717 type:complete len:290 (+) Transcript_29704:73-942(+)
MNIRVVFEVTCPTAAGEEVWLLGSLPELGSWDPAKAVRLKSENQPLVWSSLELTLPVVPHEAVQYKYAKAFVGTVPQLEVGPNRVLDLSCLSECMVNCVEDVAYDVEGGGFTRRDSGVRVRIRTASSSTQLVKSQMSTLPSRQTSRLASSVPSPLRTSAGPTPVEKSPRCRRELEQILRTLVELEALSHAGRSDIRRAGEAVRSAIEAERSGRRPRQPCRCSCAALSLLMVPLLPALVVLVMLWRQGRWPPPLKWQWPVITCAEEAMVTPRALWANFPRAPRSGRRHGV